MTTNKQTNYPAIVPVQETLRWNGAQLPSVLNVQHPSVPETAQRQRKIPREKGHPKKCTIRAWRVKMWMLESY